MEERSVRFASEKVNERSRKHLCWMEQRRSHVKILNTVWKSGESYARSQLGIDEGEDHV